MQRDPTGQREREREYIHFYIYPCNGPCHGSDPSHAFVSPLPPLLSVLPVDKQPQLPLPYFSNVIKQ
jgi:hypothetical protein